MMKKKAAQAAHVYRRGVDVTAVAKKKLSKKAKVLIIIGSVLAALIIAGTCLFFYYFGGLKTSEFTANLADLGITNKIDKDVTNIALFGVDSRSEKITGRSDAIMVLSVDNKHGKIKMTSILRDSRVAIDGHGMDKLCHAYAYGGPELAVKTLNKNFNIDITEYATVNFQKMQELVDAVGGVKIEITNAEATQISGISKGGTYNLTGKQAVDYSRIRHIDSDSARAARQQKVLLAMFDKVKGSSKAQYPEMARKLLPLMATSLDYGDCMGLAPIALTGNLQILQNTIPSKEDNAKGGLVDGTWYWQYDISAAAKRLHSFIYETSSASSSQTASSK